MQSNSEELPEVLRLDLTPEEARMLYEHFGVLCLAEQPFTREQPFTGKPRAVPDLGESLRIMAEHFQVTREREGYNEVGHSLTRKLSKMVDRLRELGVEPHGVRNDYEAREQRRQA